MGVLPVDGVAEARGCADGGALGAGFPDAEQEVRDAAVLHADAAREVGVCKAG